MASRPKTFGAITALLLATLVGSVLGPAAASAAGHRTVARIHARLVWQAGALGGGWYSQAEGLAQLFEEKIPGLTIKVVPGGGLANVPAVSSGQANIAWGLPPFDAAGVEGHNPFHQRYRNFSAIATGFGVVDIHFFVAANSPYKSIDQIFKHHMPIRIAVPEPGTSDQWVFEQMLRFYHVTDQDIQNWGGAVFNGSYDDIVNQFKDRNVDAVFVNLGIPGAAVTEAASGVKIRFLPMSKALVRYLERFNLEPGVIPKGAYPMAVNGNQNIATVAMPSEILVNDRVPANVVYAMTKVLIDDVAAVRKVHPSFATFNVRTAPDTGVVPLNPAARKAYQDAGILRK